MNLVYVFIGGLIFLFSLVVLIAIAGGNDGS